jgi:hypothetical protein
VRNASNALRTLHSTRSSRLWIFQLLGFEVLQVGLQKKNHFNFNCFYRDTQKGDFRSLEDNIGPSNKYIFRVGVGDILILLTV